MAEFLINIRQVKIGGTGSCLFQAISQCNHFLSEGQLRALILPYPFFSYLGLHSDAKIQSDAIRNECIAGKLLTGRQLSEKGFELRRAVCFMLDKHRADLEPFIAGDFDAYLHHMAIEGVWGGMILVEHPFRGEFKPVGNYKQ